MVYKTLVLSSGGVRGVAFAGCLDELVHLGVLDIACITEFAGTSVGALFAALLAVGMSTPEVLAVAGTLDIAKLVRVDLMTFIYEWGLDDQTSLRAFVTTHVNRVMGSTHVTLGDVWRSRGVNLRICATNLTLNRPDYFCGVKTPDIGVVDAVMMSMALPPMFAPVKFNEMLYVDGAFLDSFPLTGQDPVTTLGVRLDWEVACNLTSIEQFYSRLAFCALRYAEKEHKGFNIVRINVGNVSTVNLTLPPWNRRRLIADGRAAAARFVLLRESGEHGGQQHVNLSELDGDVDEEDYRNPEEDGTESGPRERKFTHEFLGHPH